MDPLLYTRCGATMKVIAVIEDEDVIYRIPSHLKLLSTEGQATSPTSEGTKPHIRLLDTDVLEIVHGTIPCLRCPE